MKKLLEKVHRFPNLIYSSALCYCSTPLSHTLHSRYLVVERFDFYKTEQKRYR